MTTTAHFTAQAPEILLVEDDPGDARFIQDALAGQVRYAIERNGMEILREASRLEAVDRMASSLADQFNDMLALVVGYSELLLTRGDPDRPDRDILEKIARGARRAAALTPELIDIGRRQRLVPGQLDLNRAIQSMTGRLREIAGPGIQLACRYGVVSPIVFDVAQLEHVLETITMYAHDEMPGGGQLTLETSEVRLAVRPSTVFVLLTITDSSQSSDQTRDVRALQSLHALAELAARRRTGLELPSVPGVMAQGGGHLEMVPCDGGGNRFCLYFPTAVSHASRS